MRKPVIAIDGYSSTGKSSISKILAERLGLIHMDTGALYRGITYYSLQCCADAQGNINFEKVFENLKNISLEFRKTGDVLTLFLDGEDISQQIRTKEVSDHVSQIACQKEVRAFLLDTQRAIAAQGGVILAGRDIGTVVLPNADYKFFLTASIEERTKRRFLELQNMGVEISAEEVSHNLTTRDKIDSEREIAPLRQAEDAILIDNSNMTKDETIAAIISHIAEF